MDAGELKELRTKAKLTREQLASKAGLTGQTIYRWETGKGKPHARLLKMLEAVLKKEVANV